MGWRSLSEEVLDGVDEAINFSEVAVFGGADDELIRGRVTALAGALPLGAAQRAMQDQLMMVWALLMHPSMHSLRMSGHFLSLLQLAISTGQCSSKHSSSQWQAASRKTVRRRILIINKIIIQAIDAAIWVAAQNAENF
jgi:hypothetical protein